MPLLYQNPSVLNKRSTGVTIVASDTITLLLLAGVTFDLKEGRLSINDVADEIRFKGYEGEDLVKAMTKRALLLLTRDHGYTLYEPVELKT